MQTKKQKSHKTNLTQLRRWEHMCSGKISCIWISFSSVLWRSYVFFSTLSASHPSVCERLYVCVLVRVCDHWSMTWLSAAAAGQSRAMVLSQTMGTRVTELSGSHSELTSVSHFLSNSLCLSLSITHKHTQSHLFILYVFLSIIAHCDSSSPHLFPKVVVCNFWETIL